MVGFNTHGGEFWGALHHGHSHRLVVAVPDVGLELDPAALSSIPDVGEGGSLMVPPVLYFENNACISRVLLDSSISLELNKNSNLSTNLL